MIGIVLTILAINLISFFMFAFRNWLERGHWGGFTISDELAGAIAIGGSFGAFMAMRIYKKGIEDDMVFKIAIPISMFIQALAIIYLLLFDLGVVK